MNREYIHSKFGGCCAYCGHRITVKQMQVDHILPKRNFEKHILYQWRVPGFLQHLTSEDLNHDSNLFPACRHCNKRKDTMDLETFRSELQLQTLRAEKTSANYRVAKRYNQLIENSHPIIFYFEKFLK